VICIAYTLTRIRRTFLVHCSVALVRVANSLTHSLAHSLVFFCTANDIFIPIVPVLVNHASDSASDSASASASSEEQPQSRVLSPTHLNALLKEEEASLLTTLAKFNDGE
jgi:hypothetical protein